MGGIIQVYQVVLNKSNFREDKNVWFSLREKSKLISFCVGQPNVLEALGKRRRSYRQVMSKRTIQVNFLMGILYIKPLKSSFFEKENTRIIYCLISMGNLFRLKKKKVKWWHHGLASEIHIRSWHRNYLKVTSNEKLFFAIL